jgi:hypothetical protein
VNIYLFAPQVGSKEEFVCREKKKAAIPRPLLTTRAEWWMKSKQATTTTMDYTK